jgi:ribokinase
MTKLTSDDAVEEKRPRVVVVGSANTDMVVRVPHLPGPGETLLGGAFAIAPGGKGANQAVAAARLGAVVTFIGCVGADSFGDLLVLNLENEGISTEFVTRDPDVATGVALITVDEEFGENTIVVAPGANAKLSLPLLGLAAAAIRSADVLLCQLEIPLETVHAALQMARSAGVQTILNPAPAQLLSVERLSLVSVLTPNQTEATQMLGADFDPSAAALDLRRRGADNVVVTLGAAGARVVSASGNLSVPAFAPKEAVDTTAAGDCFTGALAVALGEGQTLEQAVKFANAAASLSVETEGAQPSLPNRLAVNKRLMGE